MLEDHAFMDDLGQLSSTMNHLQSKKTELEDNLSKVGLKLNTKKCKDQKVSSMSKESLTVGNRKAEEVDSCTYIGVSY